MEWKKAFTVLPKSQRIVINDKIKKIIGKQKVIKVYSIDGGKLCLCKTIKPPCQHDDIKMLGMVRDGYINEQEHVAVSCSVCKAIHLIDIDTEQIREAFSGERMEHMCHGEEGKMFVTSSVDKVLELDCSCSRFTRKSTISTGLNSCFGLCYIPGLDYLITSGFGKIHTVSCRNNSVVWRVEGVIEGKTIDPEGILLYNDLILVADGVNRRILVLDLKDGSCIQSIDQIGLNHVHHLFSHQDQLVVCHAFIGAKISYFDIK